MTGPSSSLPPLELDVVAAGTAGALVSAALALLAPYLTPLPAALAALALAGWVAQLRASAGTGPVRWPAGSRIALGVLALGAGVFVAAPAPAAPYRGLALALALLPLWNLARRQPGGVP
jgi:hypothetical protein